MLQLGVTMDYSIFLLNSFEENKKRFPDDKERAMGHAIANTFKSVAGSSVTTVAGFLALCVMTFALGRDPWYRYGKRCFDRRCLLCHRPAGHGSGI